jgi:uncharacterized protein (TIGR02118 family)
MRKLVSRLRRNDDITKEDFTRWVVEEHLEYARALPGLRKYSVSVTSDPDAPYDAVNEMWFDDEEARTAAFGSEAGQAAAGDAAAHASSRTHLVTTEHELL